MNVHDRVVGQVLGVPIDVIGWESAISRVEQWIIQRKSSYICLCNAHSIVMANQDPEFGRVVAEADMATADGAPVAWLLRKLGFSGQQRISGSELMMSICEMAEQKGLPVYFYGSTTDTLNLLKKNISTKFKRLVISGSYSPPFRPMNEEEEFAEAQRINSSGAAVVFVGLGCPKQELWMNRQRGQVNGVMIGVGAAFDFYAGKVKRAPLWMQDAGLEWLHRLASEPARLWKRYLVTNTIFVMGAFGQLLFNNRRTKILNSSLGQVR
jgi:N-acetylglucosaminyldiphosphoundecaprenol N-acetyl-beta-D-mannosaminyltransferase